MTTARPYLCLLGSALFLGAVAAPAGARLTAVPAPDVPPGKTMGVSWGDLDGDGDLDAVLVSDGRMANDGTGSVLLLNQAGTLVPTASPALEVSRAARCAVLGDADGDGDADLYLVCAGEPNLLLVNDGAARFTAADAPLLADAGMGRNAAWADYDRDGDLDLYLVNAMTPNRLFRNDGEGTFADVTPPALAVSANSYAATWVDVDRDGRSDLFLSVSGSPGRLFLNRPAGFADAPAEAFSAVTDGLGSAWGDFDGDGDQDVYLISTRGNNRLLRNQGGAFTEVSQSALAYIPDSRAAAWVDYDLDGRADLYVATGRDGHRLFRNLGQDRFEATVDLPKRGHPGVGGAWADFDGDGDMDLLSANFGPDELFVNDAADGRNWLRVRLVGRLRNKAGVGARIAVTAGGRTQVQEVRAGGGSWNQESTEQLFGVSDAATVDRVEVVWPTGEVDVREGVEVNQALVVSSGLDHPVEYGSSDVALPAFASEPNPFADRTTVRFALAAPGRASLTVFDVSGRVVRRLVSGDNLAAGDHTVDWDGRDDEGKQVASGVYHYRLESGPETRTWRVIVAR